MILFFTSDAKCIAEPLEFWRPAHYQDFLSPLFLWNTLLQCSQSLGVAHRGYIERSILGRHLRSTEPSTLPKHHLLCRPAHSAHYPGLFPVPTRGELSPRLPHTDMNNRVISSAEAGTASFEPQFDLSGDQSCPGSHKKSPLETNEAPIMQEIPRVWQLCVSNHNQRADTRIKHSLTIGVS